MDRIKITINGREIEAPADSTILEAAHGAGIDIPTLCYLKEINEIGACRLCVVEVRNMRTLQAACVTRISEGMEIRTDSPKVMDSRRRTLSLLCADHHLDCEYCPRYNDCELHALFVQYGIRAKKIGAFTAAPDIDRTAPHLLRDASRCLMCRRCVAACHAQGVDAITVLGRGENVCVGAPLGLGRSNCIHCGQCICACPTGALFERDETHELRRNLEYKDKHVVGIVEPAVWASIGENFQAPKNTVSRGRLAAFLRRVGFEKIYDLSREEDGRLEELKKALSPGQTLPLVSSDCPACVEYRKQVPARDARFKYSALPYPAAAVASSIRKRSAEQLKVDPKDIIVVSISACTAQKAVPADNIDITITTRELVKTLRVACVSMSTSLYVWKNLPEEAFDNDDRPVSGLWALLPGVKANQVQTAVLNLDGMPVRTAIVSGLPAAMKLLEENPDSYDYIEVRACPCGCLCGGGQPHVSGPAQNWTSVADMRAEPIRNSL